MKSRWIRIALASTVSLRAANIAEIRSIMANRVESGRAVGMVTGVIDEKGRQVVASGKVSLDGTQQPDGDTVFEIGSVTKVFTSLILADMIEKDEVKPDDPVSKFPICIARRDTTAGWRHGVRDRLSHQGLHIADPRRHDREGRSEAGRSGFEVSPRHGESAQPQRTRDHARS